MGIFFKIKKEISDKKFKGKNGKTLILLDKTSNENFTIANYDKSIR